MLRYLLISIVALPLAVCPVSALATDQGVITGSEKATYYQFGQFGLNFQALGKPNGINVNIFPSKGSIENIFAVYQKPGVQISIVQSDVLAFVARVQPRCPPEGIGAVRMRAEIRAEATAGQGPQPAEVLRAQPGHGRDSGRAS